ncbi:MAG: hypothetical protein LBK53_04015, partial [Heliobacteriaceae bacterium]|nr:hypothetical protein [Heliobacteriaceae bacterium]
LNLSWIIRSSQKRGSAHLDEFRALPSTLAKIRCFSICLLYVEVKLNCPLTPNTKLNLRFR